MQQLQPDLVLKWIASFVVKYDFNNTYALIVISNKIAAIGIMTNPSQNTGEVNSSVCMPVNTAAMGIDGQKLLNKKRSLMLKTFGHLKKN